MFSSSFLLLLPDKWFVTTHTLDCMREQTGIRVAGYTINVREKGQ
jgi:hypothetical protein